MSIIFADSSCDLPVKFLKAHGVEVINVTLKLNGKKIAYKADNFNFAEYYLNGNYNVEIYNLEQTVLTKLTEAINTCQDVFVLTPSKAFSPLYNVASVVKKQLEQSYKEQKIFVCDTGLISGGYASVVFETAVLNSTGIRAVELNKKISSFVKGFETIIIPSTTKHEIFKNLSFGGAIGLKPIISLHNGKIENVGNLKGKLKLTEEILKRINHVGLCVADFPICVFNGKSNLADAKKITDALVENFEAQVWEGSYSPLLTNIVGDNALIISYHKRND